MIREPEITGQVAGIKQEIYASNLNSNFLPWCDYQHGPYKKKKKMCAGCDKLIALPSHYNTDTWHYSDFNDYEAMVC